MKLDNLKFKTLHYQVNFLIFGGGALDKKKHCHRTDQNYFDLICFFESCKYEILKLKN